MSQKLSKKYAFKNYDPEDIEQESFLICVEDLLPNYNGTIPLEHFLLMALSRRLLNLKRNKANPRHSAFLYALPIDYICLEDEENILIEDETVDSIAESELRKRIDRHLPAEYREDYLKLISGNSDIPAGRKKKIRLIVQEVLEL